MKNLSKINFVLIGLGVLFFVSAGFLLYSPGIQLGKIEINSPLKPDIASADTIMGYRVDYQVNSWLYMAARDSAGRICNSSQYTNSLGGSLGPAIWTVSAIDSVSKKTIFSETWRVSSVRAAVWGDGVTNKVITLVNPANGELLYDPTSGSMPNNDVGCYDTKCWFICVDNTFRPFSGAKGGVQPAGSYGVEYGIGDRTASVQPIQWYITGNITISE